MEEYLFNLWTLVRIYKYLSPPNMKKCRIWTGNMKKSRFQHGKYGHIKIKFPGRNKSTVMNVHRLLVMINMGTYSIDSHLDASHLCHNSLCCNVEHIVLEPRTVNLARRVCNAENACSGHGTFPNCLLNC